MLLLLGLLACGDKDGDDTGAHGTDGGADGGGTHGDGGTDTGSLDTSRTRVSDGGTYTVTWTPSVEPIVGEEVAISLSAVADPAPAGGFSFTAADATMPEHGHGMNVSPVVTDHGDGTATAAPFQFQMEGWWQLTVELTAADGAVETATFDYVCCG
ncbi:hypothetical protein L6R53_06840 [Myxococcota bacterium]|nr:hypothetical protein [Myxococcota bacterium]